MIVITGTQRSGTSLMARYMSSCGYDLGTNFWDTRIDGGLENPDVCNFFRDILGDNHFPFFKFWEMIERNHFYSFHNLHEHNKIVKFSYLLMQPKFVRQWYIARGNQDRFIVMTRNLEDVLRSKNSREEFYDEDWSGLNLSLTRLRKSREQSLEAMKRYGMEYVEVRFPCEPDVVQQFRDFKVPLPNNAEKIWSDIYNPTKIHFHE